MINFNVKIGTSKDQPEEHRTIIYYYGEVFDIGHFNKEYQHFDGLIFKEDTPLSCVKFWFYLPSNFDLKKAIGKI